MLDTFGSIIRDAIDSGEVTAKALAPCFEGSTRNVHNIAGGSWDEKVDAIACVAGKLPESHSDILLKRLARFTKRRLVPVIDGGDLDANSNGHVGPDDAMTWATESNGRLANIISEIHKAGKVVSASEKVRLDEELIQLEKTILLLRETLNKISRPGPRMARIG